MGTCGCCSGNQVYRLKAPKGWYVVEMMPGCDYCSHGPGVQIHQPEASVYFDNPKELPDLPVIGEGDLASSMIVCGLTPCEARTAARKCFSGSPVDDPSIDGDYAELLGEDLWKQSLAAPPRVIHSAVP